MPSIQVGAAPDGTVTYLIEHAAPDLPAVRCRDLLQAWCFARQAAHDRDWGQARAFRLVGHDGRTTDIALRDPDASCWAGAVDRAIGLGTLYGQVGGLRSRGRGSAPVAAATCGGSPSDR
jgi:hypothetical protein